MEVLRARGQGGPRGNALLIQIEAADQIFGVVIALSDMLEMGDAAQRPELQRGLRPVLPALRLLLAAIADAIVADETGDEARRAMFLRLLGEVEHGRQTEALAELVQALLQRLRVAALMTTPEGASVTGFGPDEVRPWRIRLLAPLRSNLDWDSAVLRHAARTTVVALPALLITLPAHAAYAHWLTITLLLTLQPFFASTWQRALERVGGTVLGGLVAAVLAAFVQGPLAMAALLFPLAVFAFAVRRVSFGMFMAGLTPLIVLLVELGEKGTSEFAIMAWRAGYTVAGGAMAVLGGLLLWPSWSRRG